MKIVMWKENILVVQNLAKSKLVGTSNFQKFSKIEILKILIS